MNRPLHLYMLELLTPYLFKSNRRKASQAHPSAKERSSVLKTLKMVGTMYIPSVLSYKHSPYKTPRRDFLWKGRLSVVFDQRWVQEFRPAVSPVKHNKSVQGSKFRLAVSWINIITRRRVK